MNLSIVRKSVMPLMAAGLLATGVSACNNNQQKEIMEDAREAVEYTKKFGKDGATILAYYDVYDVNALDSVQKEVDRNTELAYWDFVINRENNTRWDSVYFSNMIDNRTETQKAIEYLKEKAAGPAPTDMELDKAYSRLKNKQEKTVTAKEQDSIAKININEYKSELTQKKLLELLYSIKEMPEVDKEIQKAEN